MGNDFNNIYRDQQILPRVQRKRRDQGLDAARDIVSHKGNKGGEAETIAHQLSMPAREAGTEIQGGKQESEEDGEEGQERIFGQASS